METRCNTVRMEVIKRSFHMENCFTVPSRGFRGGLALMWAFDVDVSIQSFYNWHISAKIQGIEGESSCILTGFYGHLEASKRYSSWNLLSNSSQLQKRLGSVLGISTRH